MTFGLRVHTRSRVLLADYRPGATYGPRILGDFELVWLLRGSAQWRSEWRGPSTDSGSGGVETHLLRPGMMALARAGTRDSYSWDPDRPSSHAYVHFTLPDAGDLPDPADWPTVRDMAGIPILQGIASYLVELAGLGTDAARRRSDEMVQLLLDVFVTGPLGPEVDRLPPHIDAVVTFAAATWSDTGMRILTSDELAEAASVSTGHLYRIFRVAYGCGPVRALELVRLARAAVALQRSNASLAEVAERTGFSNPYHFSRRFAQVYGQPPGAFRRSATNPDPLAPLKELGLLAVAYPLLNTPAR